MNDQQLRTYHVEKPFSREAAAEHSTVAEGSWVYEHSTPPIYYPPLLTHEADRALVELLRAIPQEESPFGFGTWKRISDESDVFVERTGDLSRADRA